MLKQLIPARGRKPLPFRVFGAHFVRNNSSPRGDGNDIFSAVHSIILSKQLIPARGRKRKRNRQFIQRLSKQLIPARGRKLAGVLVFVVARHETTHPREGTETRDTAPEASSYSKQLIPARGRKLDRGADIAVFHTKQLIPARGRKPICPETTHPREGTETILLFFAQSLVRETTHPREGTETLNGRLLVFTNPETTHPRDGTETRCC